jgi:ATP phosphoribosyltransferase regulatory subunit
MKRLPMIMSNDLEDISEEMRGAPVGVQSAISELRDLVTLTDTSEVSLRFDVAELSGYGYHNGPVYSLYHPKYGSALAQGGRYNGVVNSEKGDHRPATGFDMDLRMFLRGMQPISEDLIFAPFVEEENKEDLMTVVEKMRGDGKNVVCALSPSEAATVFCTHCLSHEGGKWCLNEIV